MTLPIYTNLINGQQRAAIEGGILASVNPTSGETWAHVPASTSADVDAAVAAASAAFPAWARLTAAARAQHLKNAAEALRPHADDLTRLEMLAIGMPATVKGRRLTAHSLPYLFETMAGQTLEAITGRSVPLDADSFGFTRREPYGVVAAIVPFNAPLGMAASKMAIVLAAGNTLVLKPPEQASPAILRIGEILANVLPAGSINMVSGIGAAVGDPLVRHPDVRKITMTGSTGTARMIQRAAADNLTSAVFELGGKSPNIVFADADLDRALPAISTEAIFTSNAGQACVGGSRILVQRSILDEVINRLKIILIGIKVGDPFDPATTMGPVISRSQFDKIVGLIDEGRLETQLIFGGRSGSELVPDRPGGFWIEPTLFLAKDNRPRICRDEIFGPVAAIIPFDDEEEAVAIANDSSFGLAAGVWTRDFKRIHRMIRDLETGNVWVNTYMETRLELPFAGVKDSGYGHDQVLEFTREKSAVINTL